MDYDKKLKSIIDEEIVEYGIVNGNNTILLIKTGQNGSIYGYENKYLNIAVNMNKKYGYTVICSSNPFKKTNPLDDAIDIVEEYCTNNFDDYEIYYMGFSNGARLGMTYGYKYPKITKFLLINSPIMYNWPESKFGINNLLDTQIFNIVYGEYDQSYRYVDLLKPLLKSNVKLDILKDTDHEFRGKLNEFIKLPEDYFV